MTPKRIVTDGFRKGRPPIMYRHRCEECRVIFACWPCPHHRYSTQGVNGDAQRRICDACKDKPEDAEPATVARMRNTGYLTGQHDPGNSRTGGRDGR